MRSELAKAKTDVKNFGKVSEGALDAFGSALGVNVGKIKEVSSAIQGMGQKMTQSSSEAVKGLGSMLKGVNALQAGVAGIGVAALIAGFKELKAEAEYFLNTVEGYSDKLAHQGWMETYKAAFHDVNKEVAKETAEQIQEMEKGWTRFWQTTKQSFKNALFNADGWDVVNPVAGVVRDIVGTVKYVSDVAKAQDEINAKAERGEAIKRRIGELDELEVANSVEISSLSAQIAEYQKDMMDTSLPLSDRTNARAEAERLIKRQMELQLPIAEERAALMKEYHRLTDSTLDGDKEDASLQIQVNTLRQQQATALKSLNRQSRSLTTEASKQSAEYQKQLEAIRALKQSRQDLAAWGSDITAPSSFATPQATIQVPAEIIPQVDKDNFQSLLDAQIGQHVRVYIGCEIDTESLHDISDQLNTMLEQVAVSTSETIGQLVGDLLTGGDAWNNFTTTALSSLADMMQQVGKMAIQCGTAMIGIKAALNLDNPYIAIAAGAALVALGAAVKAGLKNIANGNFSTASSSVASGSYGSPSASSAATGYNERELNIKVTGTLKASGSDLVTVLTNENKRRLATT